MDGTSAARPKNGCSVAPHQFKDPITVLIGTRTISTRTGSRQAGLGTLAGLRAIGHLMATRATLADCKILLRGLGLL